jgi:hypothetical protein
MDPFPIRKGVLPVANQTDPISAPSVDPDVVVEHAPKALHVRPCGVALVPAGVVTFDGVSRDIQLCLLCRILRRLHHVQPRVETIRLIHRRYWAGMANAVGTVLVTIAAAAAGLAVAGL